MQVVGFGTMTYARNKVEFKLRPVGSTVIPATIDIVSSGGALLTVPVEGVEPPQLPGAASNPSPADNAANVDINTDLGWNTGSQTDTHDVYFGTSTSPAEVSTGQTSSSYDPGVLEEQTTYYWRVDEVNTLGITTGAL